MKWLLNAALLTVTVFCFVPAQFSWAEPAHRPATRPAGEQQFLRFVEDKEGGAKLEAALVTYRNPAGVTVHLVSALHVGEKQYYEGLSKTFTTYDALLYEMIMPKGGRPPRPGEQSHSGVSTFQRFLKDTLNLDFQLDDIDYTKPNFIHADLDSETFFAMQKERGESLISIMLRSMLREMERDLAGEKRKTEPMTLFDLLIALRAPDRARQLKLLLGRQFGDIEDQMAGLDGPNGSVIITERNKKCLETLTKAIADGHKNIGIFYGAGHMHDMSKRLEKMGFHEAKWEWRVGWDMTAPPATQPAPAAK